MAGAELVIKTGSTVIGAMLVSDGLWCDENEEYLTSPLVSGGEEGDNVYGGHIACTFTTITSHTGGIRGAGYIIRNGYNGDSIILSTGYGDYYGVRDSDNIVSGNIPYGIQGYAINGFTSLNGTFATNIPIFENLADAVGYIQASTDTQAFEYLKLAVNYRESEQKEIEDYYIYNTYSNAEIEYGEVSFDDTIIQRYERLKLYSTPALYIDDNDPFLCHLAYDDNDIVASVFSSTSIFDVEVSPQWVEGHVEYTYPFYKMFENEEESGSYTIGRTWLTNIPLFGSMTDAVDFINGIKPITDALNWRNIAGDYPDIISNDTGVTDEETEFGEVYVQGFFSQQYLCGRTALANIASSFFDIQGADPSIIGIWEEIKKGVEMYGQDPMQAVQGLMYFPINLSEIFTNTQSQNYIYFGGYKLDLTANVEKLIFANGYKSIGSITINKSFNDWRDYEPYTKLYVYLPYCGTFQLQLARYYGKSTEVRYYIDTRTGGCLVCLIADGMLIDYFNGQMGVQMPITLTDKSAYANTQINTLLKGVGGIGDIVKSVGGNIATGGSVPVELAFGALNAGVDIAKTEYNLTQNNVTNYNKTSGGSTSMLNEYLPQHVTFMFEIQQIEDSPNEVSLQGQPTNASGTVGSFSGYLEVEEVNLLCGNATENEKRQIVNMLRTGVII